MQTTTCHLLDHLQRGRVLTAAQWDSLQTATAESETTESLTSEDLADRLIARGWLTRFQSQRLLEGRARELQVGPYVLTDLIGVGGIGSVYAAVHAETREAVAVKVLSRDYKQDAGMRARFRIEARAGGRVEHPNLVRTLDWGTTDDVFGEMDYMAMELFPGIALHELLSVHGPLLWSTACDMLVQAAAGLQHLHELGLIHRDIKPDNLLVDRTGRVKVIDYGLALAAEALCGGKGVEDGEEFALTMLFGQDCLGTPDYMPPEQARDSLTVGPAADVYGLGCTFFTALTGRRPFQGPNKAGLIAAHTSQPVPRVRDVAPRLPKEIDDVVARMMAKNPAERFQSMDGVILALTSYAIRQPVRFKYEELLTARAQLAARKSSIAKLSATGRSQSSIRGGILARYIDTKLAAETDIEGVTAVTHRKVLPTAPAPPVATAAEAAAGAIAAYTQEAPAVPASKRLLEFSNGFDVPIEKRQFTIGRSDQCDLSISAGDLSAQHCRLEEIGDDWLLRDLGSRNGTRVNGERVTEAVLKPGDRVTLGSATSFTLVDPVARRTRRLRQALLLVVAVAMATGAAAVAALMP
jgi:serine/threonine protein kinase